MPLPLSACVLAVLCLLLLPPFLLPLECMCDQGFSLNQLWLPSNTYESLLFQQQSVFAPCWQLCCLPQHPRTCSRVPRKFVGSDFRSLSKAELSLGCSLYVNVFKSFIWGHGDPRLLTFWRLSERRALGGSSWCVRGLFLYVSISFTAQTPLTLVSCCS